MISFSAFSDELIKIASERQGVLILFHGTKPSRIPSILKDGLKLQRMGQGFDGSSRNSTEPTIFLSSNRDHSQTFMNLGAAEDAVGFIAKARALLGIGVPGPLEVRIPVAEGPKKAWGVGKGGAFDEYHYNKDIPPEWIKTARLTSAEKADKHHSSEVKDWNSFEKNLNIKGFQNAILGHKDSDDKLKSYVQNFGGYLKSKKVVAVMPSRTSTKIYKIKELSTGRLACGCKDWQYYHSVRNSDCDHIMDAKAGGMIKKSGLLTSAVMAHGLGNKVKGEWEAGKRAKNVAKALQPPGPKKTWEDRLEDISALSALL